MMQSKWFKRGEFACKCGCGFNTVDAELLQILEGVRMYFNKAVKVSSGCRCPSHNFDIGGAMNSRHKQGRAADITVKDTSPQEVYDHLNEMYPDTLGLGKYNTFTHVDSRVGKARW
jgi:uncharacterized protein YcbK (DUF882 family)